MEQIQNALNDEQRLLLERLIQESKHEGREEARAALRSTVAGSRKPEA